MDNSIFKNYDVRGIYPIQLDVEAATKIAQTFLMILKEATGKEIKDLHVIVGRDIRESSLPLMRAVMDVFMKYGVQVDDMGLVSINDLYFANGYYKYDGGIVATASHNPPQYGGFKLTTLSPDKKAIKFISGKAILEKMDKLQLPIDEPEMKGTTQNKDVSLDHLNHILSFIKADRLKKFKVVVDTGNGMMGLLMSKIFERMPCNLIPLFTTLDNTFPNRAPNPLDKGAHDKLSSEVLRQHADFGFIYDVDGDRMFMVDEKGQFIRGDMILLLLAKAMLRENPGAGIAYNLICSHAVPELITKWGGKAIRSEVGYRFLAKHMLEQDGIMSGEVSAHFAFRDNYYADSGFVALVLVLKALSEDNRSLSEIIKEFTLYYRADELNLKVKDINTEFDKIRDKYKDNILDEIDGITVEFDNWWFNVRPSNTEPLLRITVEAADQSSANQHQQELISLIDNI